MSKFSYFYDNQSENFTFYRILKILFTDEHFAKLSTEAKTFAYAADAEEIRQKQADCWDMVRQLFKEHMWLTK